MKGAPVLSVSDSHMPSLFLNEKQLPALAKWRVGGRYRLVVDVEQTGMNNQQPPDGSKGKEMSGTFRILSVTPVETSAGKDVILKTLADKAKKA